MSARVKSPGAPRRGVSVIIPTCDRPHMLAEAIASVRAQTCLPREIIVADNGAAPLEAKSLPRGVKVLPLPPRCGPSLARNAGAEAAAGEFLAFLDDDDRWERDYLGHLLKAAAQENADCAIGERVRFYPDGRRRPYANPLPAAVARPSDRNFHKAPGFGGTNFLIRRSAFLAVGGFDPALTIAEDQDLFVRLARAGTRFALVPQAVCQVRQHPGPRLRDRVLSGTWAYYRKHSADLTPGQRLQFALRLANALKKHVRRPLRAWFAPPPQSRGRAND